MTNLGPLVPRGARVAGALFAFASLLFVAAMLAVELLWKGYSVSGNAVSDLGSSASPLPQLFNGALILLGGLVFLAVILVVPAFQPRTSRSVGLLLALISGASAIGIGVAPEDSGGIGPTLHHLFTGITFIGGGLAILSLSLAMRRDTRWEGYRFYTFVSGLFGLVCAVLYLRGIYLGLGVGGMERAVIAPLLLWLIVAGVHLARIPSYAPSVVSSLASA